MIYAGDAKELSKNVADESIDLIFTDPVYQNIEDYAWLAETAARILKPDSACLAWYGGSKPCEVKRLMGEHLKWTWDLKYVVPAKPYPLRGYNIFCWTTMLFWFRKGKGYPVNRVPDTFISSKRPDNGFKWNKNIAPIKYWLSAFLPDGGTVFDPFAGSGTVGVACQELGLGYIGFEIDEDRAAEAQDRIDNTPPNMFVEQVVQTELSLDKHSSNML